MGVRQHLNERRGLSLGLAGAAIAIAVVLIYQQGSSNATSPFEGRAWLTVDDGKTFFPAKGTLLPPVEHNGKIAYRANVFTCDGGNTTWVGYLERYSDHAKAVMVQMHEEQKKGAMPQAMTELLDHIEIKRPGENVWVRQSNIERAAAVMATQCPHGAAHDVDYHLP